MGHLFWNRGSSRRIVRALALLGVLHTVPASVDLGAQAPTVEGTYRIQPGDQLDIKLFYNPTLNEQVLVRPDGHISLQLVQEVMAAGMTPAELTKELTTRYAADLRQPEVTVIVRSFGAQRVFVDGEVATPGVVPIVGATTVLQAIAQAGGLTRSARTSEVVLIRRGADAPIAMQVDLEKARRADVSQDVLLMPFDIVYVPRSRMANVNIWMDQYIRQNIPIPFSLNYGYGTLR